MNKGFTYWFLSCIGMVLLAWLICIVLLSSCSLARKGAKDAKVSVHDTLMVHDSIAVHDTVSSKEYRYVHDTAIGVAGQDIIYTPLNPLSRGENMHDTVIVRGPMRLIVRDNSIECREDSLTLVIANMVRIIDSNRSLAVVSKADSVTERSVESEVLGVKARWYAVWFDYVKNSFAVVGVCWMLWFLGPVIIKKFV